MPPVDQAIRVAVDIVLFTVREKRLSVLLIERGIPPFQGTWAMPGGLVQPKESLEDAAVRELREETGVADIYLEQLYTFGEPGRDPRNRVVSVAYFALISPDHAPRAGTDAADARWWPIDECPQLAFDHRQVLDVALQRLRNKLEWTTVGFQLLPEKFTLTALQQVYEAILDKKIDKRNFRRKMALLKILTPLKEQQRDGQHRPAQLFKFSAGKFERLRDKGILFPF